MEEAIVLSTLPKTWIFDLDGTLLKHNGYKIDGEDTILEGVKEYFSTIPDEDYILLLTSRTDEYKDMTLSFLKKHNIRFNEILFNIPMGERIVINDRKPSGIDMSVAINFDRHKTQFPKVIREL
jgi:FMN phosphatase YigB (HAD superfamily)